MKPVKALGINLIEVKTSLAISHQTIPSKYYLHQYTKYTTTHHLSEISSFIRFDILFALFNRSESFLFEFIYN